MDTISYPVLSSEPSASSRFNMGIFRCRASGSGSAISLSQHPHCSHSKMSDELNDQSDTFIWPAMQQGSIHNSQATVSRQILNWLSLVRTRLARTLRDTKVLGLKACTVLSAIRGSCTADSCLNPIKAWVYYEVWQRRLIYHAPILGLLIWFIVRRVMSWRCSHHSHKIPLICKDCLLHSQLAKASNSAHWGCHDGSRPARTRSYYRWRCNYKYCCIILWQFLRLSSHTLTLS